MLKKLLAFTLLTLSMGANSATLVVSGGQLVGATGVDVDGTLYDVEFLEGSCNTLFSGCTDFDFTTYAAATLASQALLDQVFLGVYDADATLTFGIVSAPGHAVTPVPLAQDPTNTTTRVMWRAKNFSGTTEDVVVSAILLPAWDTNDIPGSVFADWTPSAVPLPAAAWLFGAAILGLGGLKRKKA